MMPHLNKRVLFIGLGVMGFPMAGWLVKKGFDVQAYNRSPEVAERWSKEYSTPTVSDLTLAIQASDIVVTCIGNDRDLAEVYLSESGLLAHLKPGSLAIDHTTASADIAKQIYTEAQGRNIDFIDAPVSGGQQGAVNGALTTMCGGDSKAFDKAKPFIESYSKAVSLMGSSGSGQLTKMVNQITIAGLIQSLSEALHFAEKSGLDQQQVIDVISKGAAQSWQMDNRSKTMIAKDYNDGFAVDLMRKDLSICLNHAREVGATIPVAALVDQFYSDIQATNGGRWDTSSLLTRLQK